MTSNVVFLSSVGDKSVFSILLIATTAAIASPATPTYGLDARQPNAYNGVIYAPTTRTVGADIAHRQRVAALRTDGLRMQAEDGGTLTPQHRAELQHRLDVIERRYAEMRRRADLFSVDANGRAVYSATSRPHAVEPPGITAQP